MTDELDQVIESLREISPKLNVATDQATAAIKAVEQFLNEECNLGIRTKVEMGKGGATLAYERVSGKYAIVVRRKLAGFDQIDVTPVASLPRDEKLNVVTWLPYLLKEVLRSAQERIESAGQVGEAIKPILSALSNSKKD